MTGRQRKVAGLAGIAVVAGVVAVIAIRNRTDSGADTGGSRVKGDLAMDVFVRRAGQVAADAGHKDILQHFQDSSPQPVSVGHSGRSNASYQALVEKGGDTNFSHSHDKVAIMLVINVSHD